jgi:hypothetical protein
MRTFSWIGILMVGFVSGGATCARRESMIPMPPPPVVLSDTPTLEELAETANRTASVRQLSSNSATVTVLSMPKLPRLTNATLHLERDQRFRLRASLPIVLGAGVDMGSNDEMFWFEVPESIGTKTLYYARHEQYRQQLERAVLPVDPTWVMDALGLVQVDPATVVAGPVRRSDGKLEIRSTLAMPDGTYQRVCMIQPGAGYVTDQLLYGPRGTLIAQSRASEHVYYDAVQCALPHRVEVKLTPLAGEPLEMRIEVGSYAVNQLLSGDPNLFAMPQTASNAVDLTTLSMPAATVMSAPPTSYRETASASYPLRGSRH